MKHAAKYSIADIKQLGTVLVTGGAGFLGKNFVKTLLDHGLKVKSFDIVESDLEHENLEVLTGNICDTAFVEDACTGVDTIFHTAAIICLKGGAAVTQEYRDQSYAINVQGTKNLLTSLQKAGGKRFVYTSSNSVVISGKSAIAGGTEDMSYVKDFNDLYTETKVISEKWVLSQDGKNGIHTCAIRPSGIWGPGDQTFFKMLFEQAISGVFVAKIGRGSPKLDNSHVDNLIHGQILAALHLEDKGNSSGQAYFINDDDPVNVYEFAEPVLDACGFKSPKITLPGFIAKLPLQLLQTLHFRFKFPEPPLTPLAIDRVTKHNYFSVEKARQQIGYEPIVSTKDGLEASIPFYVEMFNRMKKEAGK